ncbi:hypothetical protein NC653_025015 [Populus alba x Populus x berolinensis]|uniref:Uncharacterized protein n=1 Tax=Populus alba x Populus x berolinensis TaxID=444605 RepID=A0AAD6Q7H3_9ROSI|nr:hypothetical protein NC653_025015 [Populus alba x Populus x berolinensis]
MVQNVPILLFREKSLCMSWVLKWILTVPPAPKLQTPPPNTPRKGPTRKIISRHPSFRMLTL